MKVKSKILITGASGFIGKSVCSVLLSKGFEIFEFNRSDGFDILDLSSFDKLNGIKIDHIIHLAGATFVPDSWKNPTAFFNTNLMGTTNVLEYCKKINCNMTFISAYLYGAPEKVPISEDDSIMPNNPYALSKHMAEQVCKFYCDSFDLSVTCLRLFNVFGNGQKEPFLLPLIINQVLDIKSNEITVNSLTPKRDFIYIKDVVSAIIKTIEVDLIGFNVFNIGSGKSYSVEDVIEIICGHLKISKKIISREGVRKNEISDVISNISKAICDLNWSPSYSFQDGIKDWIYLEFPTALPLPSKN